MIGTEWLTNQDEITRIITDLPKSKLTIPDSFEENGQIEVQVIVDNIKTNVTIDEEDWFFPVFYNGSVYNIGREIVNIFSLSQKEIRLGNFGCVGRSSNELSLEAKIILGLLREKSCSRVNKDNISNTILNTLKEKLIFTSLLNKCGYKIFQTEEIRDK